MSVLLQKGKEVLYSVLPITLIVLLLHGTITPLEGALVTRFLIGAGFIVAGLAVFLAGVDLGISPLGNHVGATLSKSNRVWIVVAVGLVVGFFISIAEPDLQILAGQVESVIGALISRFSILIAVSLGIAVMLGIGMIRIVYNFPLYKLLSILYGIIFLLALLVSPEFLAIAFDASGATTGALTVPFILALARGVSALKKDSKASEKDSFGLVGVTSTGAIFGVLLLGIGNRFSGLTGALPPKAAIAPGWWAPFAQQFPTLLGESLLALLPLALILLAFHGRARHFSRRSLRRMLKGLGYAWIGLALFLTGVHAGFMEVGVALGDEIARLPSGSAAVLVGLLLGLVTILAEPAVHILTRQIEVVTSGSLKRGIVLAALSAGVGAAVALSILRILVPGIQLWHYLLPGFGLSVALSFFAPKLFVGIAFDAGGVASGPMTATFILAFAQGVADASPGANVLRDAFGMIALVAMTPIVALQALGIVYKLRSHPHGGMPDAKARKTDGLERVSKMEVMQAGADFSSVQETRGRRGRARPTDARRRNGGKDAQTASSSFLKQPLKKVKKGRHS